MNQELDKCLRGVFKMLDKLKLSEGPATHNNAYNQWWDSV